MRRPHGRARTTTRCARCSSRCGTRSSAWKRTPELAPGPRRAARALRLLPVARASRRRRCATRSTRPAAARATRRRAPRSTRPSAAADRGVAARAHRPPRGDRPDYPADYARGVASYRRGDFGASARAFRAVAARPPRRPARPSRPELPSGGRRRRARGVSPMRALLVDDDRELARLLADYLGPHGVALDHVEDGALGARPPRRRGRALRHRPARRHAPGRSTASRSAAASVRATTSPS